MAVSWFLSGAQTPSGATVTAKLSAGAASCRLGVSTTNFGTPTFGAAAVPDANNYVKVTITGLAANTLYYYRLEIDGSVDATKTGQFRTFPTAGSPATFTFASASCNETASNHPIFSAIAAQSPLFFAHVGDRHYSASDSSTEANFRTYYETGMATANQSAMYLVTPAPYMWDDHDFGPNNADATGSQRAAANAVYRQVIPHYPLVSQFGIYHHFDVGLVRFIMTDLRSFRSPDTQTDGRYKSMLGPTQKKWFKDLIETSASDGTRAIVWANTSQWPIDDPITGAVDLEDCWYSFAYERAELARHMERVGCPPVVIISGDAHEIAGRLDYEVGGFHYTVYQNAALDRPVNTRGGYWDFGPVQGTGGHYGLITITDDGDATLTCRWRAMNVTSGGTETTLFDNTIDLHPRIGAPAVQSHHAQRRGS